MNKKIIITLLIVVLPLIAFAQTNSSASTGSYSPFKLLNGSISPQGSAWTFKLPYLGGSGSQLVCVDNSGLFSITGCPSGGGGGAAGVISTTTPLVNTQVVFSTGVASIGNDSAFTYNAASDRLTVSYASTTAQTITNAFVTKLSNLTSNGFVKTSGSDGTLSVDTNSYLTGSGAGLTAVSVASSNGFAGSSSGGATPILTLSTTITGLLKGNGTAISAAVSGTDIKTINGTSILGSGDITISGGTGNVSTSTGETTGHLSYWTTTNGTPARLGSVGTSTLSASSPLTGSFIQIGSGGSIGCTTASSGVAGCLSSTHFDTFNNKQAALVSGTNIKTINGSSVLGSGDLTVTGGSGLASSTPWTLGNLVVASSVGAVTTISTSTLRTSQLTNDAAFITAITGGTCTNQFVRSLSTAGLPTCATVANTDLANSTISGVSLGGTLANLTATDSTLTFSGTYTGATARTIGLNLGNANTWTARQTFNYSSSTIYSSFVTSSSTTGYFGTVFIPNLGTAAGSFLAVNASGQVIATTTPSGGGGGVSGSGTTNTISKFTGATSIGNSGLTDDGSELSYAGGDFTVSNVGDVTAQVVNANDVQSGTFTGANSATGTFLYSTSTPFGIISINPTQFDAKHPLVIGSSTATSLIVRQGGNVGIGTSTPGSIFSIQGVANFVASAMSTIYNGLRILGTLVLPNLGTPAGAFLAVDPSGNVIATTTPSGGSSSPSIDTSYSHIIDEFAGNVDSYLYKDISTLSWEVGNFTPYLQYGTSTNPGVMSFYPGYGVNNVGWLSLGNTTSASFTGSIGSKTNWELRFVFRTASVSTQSVYRVGLMDTTMNSQTPSNGIWLRYNNNSACTTTGSDATWIYENRNGGTSSTATGPSFGTNTWTHLRMRSTTTGVVGFSVSQNGGAFSTEQLISTNIPTSALAPTFQITNCANQYLYPQLDRFDWLQTNLTR